MGRKFSSCLRHMINIQIPLEEDNKEIWQDFAMVRAEVQAMYEKSPGEAFTAMQIIDNSFYRFRIRFMPEIKNNMRIIYNKRCFYIKRIINQAELNLVSIIITQENL